MKRLHLAAALALAALILPGCQNVGKQMSVGEFVTYCNDQFSWNDDCDSGGICNAFQAALDKQYPDRASCHAACDKVDTQEWMANVTNECAVTVGNASDWCEQYCNRKYPK